MDQFLTPHAFGETLMATSFPGIHNTPAVPAQSMLQALTLRGAERGDEQLLPTGAEVGDPVESPSSVAEDPGGQGPSPRILRLMAAQAGRNPLIRTPSGKLAVAVNPEVAAVRQGVAAITRRVEEEGGASREVGGFQRSSDGVHRVRCVYSRR